MALKIETVKKLEVSYMLCGRLTSACKEIGVSFKAGQRYFKIHDWESKRKKLLSKLEKQEEVLYSDFFKENLAMIKQLKKKFKEILPKIKLNPKSFNISDFERLLKLEAFVFGADTEEDVRPVQINIISKVPRPYEDIKIVQDIETGEWREVDEGEDENNKQRQITDGKKRRTRKKK